MNPPSSRTPRKAASSLGMSGPYSALTSTSGIVCIRLHLSCGSPSVHEIRREQENACDDRVLDVVEAVVEAVVARAEPVAGTGEGERPDRRSDQREDGVRGEAHLEDPRRDRDEGADDRRHPPEQDAEVPPADEPRLGAIETLGREVEPAAALLEERTPAVASDRPADERAGEIAERPGEREHDEGSRAEADVGAEQGHSVRGLEDSGRDGARIEHHELAQGGEDGVDGHEPEDGVDTVIRDGGGEARGDAREEHERRVYLPR